ncbi:hypothetical protein CXG81DRAFT_13294 [Caulochytrium protostelioides]|uniref:Phosphodiesterase n=1 Tax=Caulochytrium protostelioides TaxID=1555241 RepID=A0A4P9X5I5_9FUNG|nr:hypothetical protein CXG81DRAFT_13294 [Caulochytrium protostelioides]|eukprot:RKP00394.1 hypothetical protein CXG81DRAFT_13294 [Caulochytrium protostelioides]
MAVGPLQTYRWPNAFAFAAKPTACQRPISGEIQCQCWQGYAPVLTADDTYVCDLKIDLKINWALEGVVLAGILVVVLSLGRLQVFVNKYALARVERGLLVQRLKQQNADLTLQLNKIQPRAEPLLDLDSPITKVIACIRQIQASNRLDSDASEELDFVVEVLSSNQLFLPNLLRVNKDAMDGEVNQWLTNMIMNQNTQAPSQGSRPGSVMHTHYSNAGSAPHLSLSERIATFLGDMNAWSFDLVALQELTQGQPLYYLGMAIFEYHNFEQTLGIDPDVMRNFLRRVEGSYRKVPYHNSAHAADVMHALHYFVSQMGLAQVITTEECLAAFIAAAVHDVDHLGVNNAFLINSDHQLAIRYNDTSVLENHHCAKAFAIMFGDPRDNPLSGFVGERFTAIRAVIVGMVLATDMAGHFERMTKFKSKMAGGGMVVTDVKDRQLILNTAIKCGDISNAAKPREISLKWTHLIMEEFYNQGDQERARGLPVSTFMDRQAPQVPKCQSSFIDYIVMPLFEAWGMYIDPQGQFEAIQNLNANREYWRQQSTELGKVVVK